MLVGRVLTLYIVRAGGIVRLWQNSSDESGSVRAGKTSHRKDAIDDAC